MQGKIMLTLTRRRGERLILFDSEAAEKQPTEAIIIEVARTTKMHITAPDNIRVLRAELLTPPDMSIWKCEVCGHVRYLQTTAADRPAICCPTCNSHYWRQVHDAGA